MRADLDDPTIASTFEDREQAVEAEKRIHGLVSERERLTREYYATPDGFKELEQLIEGSHKPKVKEYWAGFLDQARAQRHAQLKAYKRVHGNTTPHHPTMSIVTADSALNTQKELKETTPEGNIMLGRKHFTRNNDLPNETLTQQRVDLLVYYFTNEAGHVYTPFEMVEDLGERDCVPGFKLLGVGGFRAAFLDEETGWVVKIPVDERVRPEDETSDSGGYAEVEQYHYALLDTEELAGDQAEYAETMFYRSTTHPSLPIVVQRYLPDNLYEQKHLPEGFANRLMDKYPLWDVTPENTRYNKETGKYVLLDCFPPSMLDSDW